MVGCVLKIKVSMFTLTPWPCASHIATLCPRCSSNPHAVESCLLEAARLRTGGAEWDAAFEEAGVEDTSPARQSVYRIIREAKEEAKRAEAAEAEAKAKGGRGPRPKRPGPRPRPNGAAREPPWAAEGWGRRRPDAPLWRGCCSSLILIIGAAALNVA